jgi:anti-anti-sigma factor
MQARVKQEGDVTVIALSGRVDMDSSEAFRKICIEQFSRKKVVFDLGELGFVGSTGVTTFLETMRDLHHSSSYGVRLVGPKAEFRRLLSSYILDSLQVYDTETMALGSFLSSPLKMQMTTLPTMDEDNEHEG